MTTSAVFNSDLHRCALHRGGDKGLHGAADYLMVHTLTIKHFRCYDELKVSDLKRVNVVVGANGSGKTAFLEAIFLASGGSPELALRLQNFRGMGTAHEVAGGDLRALWRDLFFGFNQKLAVKIALIDNAPKPRTLSVSLVEDEDVSLPIEEFELDDRSGVQRNVPIEFVWSDASGVYKSRPVVSENGRITFSSARKINTIMFFPAQFRLDPEETAKRLSEISKRDDLDGLVAVINRIYPAVVSASVENHAGSWQVFVKLANLKSRIPIALHSAGATKFVAILMGIAAADGGCVLIDEIENGFYYETMPTIWEALYEVAAQFSCQLFVTTHSMESLNALLPVLEKHGKSFALLKAVTTHGKGSVVVSSGPAMSAAIEQGIELR